MCENKNSLSAPTEREYPKRQNEPVSNLDNNIIPQKIKKSTTNFKTFEVNIFSQAKDMLNIREVLEYYG